MSTCGEQAIKTHRDGTTSHYVVNAMVRGTLRLFTVMIHDEGVEVFQVIDGDECVCDDAVCHENVYRVMMSIKI